MTNLKILLKNSFNCFVGSLQGKKDRKKMTAMIPIVILFALGLLALAFLQSFSQFFGLSPLGLSKLVVFNGFLITLITVILIGVMKTTSSKVTSDTELLLSLPIKKSIIALSKILTRYLFDFAFAFLLLFPYIIIYMVYEGFSIFILLFGLLSILLIPLASMGLEDILNFVITRVFNKTKYASLLKSFISIIFFLGTMAIFAFTMPNYGLINPADVTAFINNFPPVSWFVQFVFEFNILSFVYILLITILPFSIGVILYTQNFGKTFSAYKNKDSENITYKTNKNAYRSLLQKELKRYVQTPIYILNTIIGPIFIIVATVVVCIKGSAGLSELLGMPIANDLIFAILTLMFVSFTFLTMISCSAISLEGKNLWILKSTPVSEKDIFLSKSMPNIIFTAPVLLVCSIIISILLEFTLLQALFFIVIPLLSSLIISFGGLLINLFLPKFDWVDEANVVKQGFSTLVTMLLGFVSAFIPIGMYLLFPSLALTTIGILTLIIYFVICLLCITLLFTKGKQLFRKL